MAKKKEEVQKDVEPAAAPLPQKVHFDSWWARIEKKIPGQHRKEIVLADFRARGLSLSETVEAYHEALKKYGVQPD